MVLCYGKFQSIMISTQKAHNLVQKIYMGIYFFIKNFQIFWKFFVRKYVIFYQKFQFFFEIFCKKIRLYFFMRNVIQKIYMGIFLYHNFLNLRNFFSEKIRYFFYQNFQVFFLKPSVRKYVNFYRKFNLENI